MRHGIAMIQDRQGEQRDLKQIEMKDRRGGLISSTGAAPERPLGKVQAPDTEQKWIVFGEREKKRKVRVQQWHEHAIKTRMVRVKNRITGRNAQKKSVTNDF